MESAGKSVEPGTSITVKVSDNSQVEVPEVTGLSQEIAQDRLEQAGLNFSIETIQAEGNPGDVAKQSVAKGKKVDKGSTVVLSVIGEPVEESPSPDPSTGETPPEEDDGSGGGTSQ